jgi:Fe2+ or Zn2+ uptake regulation protein
VNNKDQKISERIMKYLQERPHACDTLEGISRFWMEFERVDQSVDAVKNVLEILVEKGAVIKIERNGDMSIYKVAM